MRPHTILEKKIQDIFKNSGFTTDREVEIEINGEKFNLDVCAVYREVLIVVECKTGKNVDFKDETSSWNDIKNKIEKNFDRLVILKSADKVLNKRKLKDIKIFKIIIAAGDYPKISEDAYKLAKPRSIDLWDNHAIDYYRITSSALKIWTKYEILRELSIETEESKKSVTRTAFEIIQPGSKMYIFSLNPYELLQIAYVFRRSLHEKEAYQRMIKENRIDRISKFLAMINTTLPNNVIISFDKDVENEISYDNNTHEITIPLKYCSAWIVDGQHRLYGFTRTKYSKAPRIENRKLKKFELIVVGIKNLDEQKQASMFIDINYNQQRIDRTLLCDLTTLIKDLRNKLTWPSLLVTKLNNSEPWLDRIKIREIHRGRSVTLASFTQFALLQNLLGYKEQKGKIRYEGPLFKIAPFSFNKKFGGRENSEAFEKQFEILKEYFLAVRKWTSSKSFGTNKWENFSKYGLTKATGVNALLLVLNRMLESGVKVKDFKEFLKPIRSVRLTRKAIKKYGGGWVGFRGLANKMIGELNKVSSIKLNYYYQK